MNELSFLTIPYIVKQLGLVPVLALAKSRLCSLAHYYILRGALSATALRVPTGSKVTISPLGEDDIDDIKDSLASCDAADRKEILARLLFYKSGFKNCYVIRCGNKIAYMQWIIYPEENDVIMEKYRNRFDPLHAGQVMVENAFTFPAFRGLGYLQRGTQQLLDLAWRRGYRSAVCYIRKENIASLNGFCQMGFRITKIVPEYKFLARVWRSL